MLIFGCIGIVLGIVLSFFGISEFNGRIWIIGIIILLLSTTSIGLYVYTYKHADPSKIYIDMDCIDNGLAVTIKKKQCVEIPFSYDHCEIIDSVTVKSMDFKEYLETIQKK